MLSDRSYDPELLDLGPAHYTPDEYRDCLRQLDRIGRYLGGNRATFQTLDRLPNRPQSILDVGCGSGQFTRCLAERYSGARVEGIDISTEAIAIAQAASANVRFYTSYLQDVPNQYDVVTATLVTHHLGDQELIAFLRQACEKAKQAVVINDLHRHVLALCSFKLISPLLFPNRLIQHDGALSIRRAFTRADWWRYLDAAGIKRGACRVSWHWAFRWMVTIDTSTHPFV